MRKLYLSLALIPLTSLAQTDNSVVNLTRDVGKSVLFMQKDSMSVPLLSSLVKLDKNLAEISVPEICKTKEEEDKKVEEKKNKIHPYFSIEIRLPSSSGISPEIIGSLANDIDYSYLFSSFRSHLKFKNKELLDEYDKADFDTKMKMINEAASFTPPSYYATNDPQTVLLAKSYYGFLYGNSDTERMQALNLLKNESTTTKIQFIKRFLSDKVYNDDMAGGGMAHNKASVEGVVGAITGKNGASESGVCDVIHGMATDMANQMGLDALVLGYTTSGSGHAITYVADSKNKETYLVNWNNAKKSQMGLAPNLDGGIPSIAVTGTNINIMKVKKTTGSDGKTYIGLVSVGSYNTPLGNLLDEASNIKNPLYKDAYHELNSSMSKLGVDIGRYGDVNLFHGQTSDGTKVDGVNYNLKKKYLNSSITLFHSDSDRYGKMFNLTQNGAAIHLENTTTLVDKDVKSTNIKGSVTTQVSGLLSYDVMKNSDQGFSLDGKLSTFPKISVTQNLNEKSKLETFGSAELGLGFNDATKTKDLMGGPRLFLNRYSGGLKYNYQDKEGRSFVSEAQSEVSYVIMPALKQQSFQTSSYLKTKELVKKNNLSVKAIAGVDTYTNIETGTMAVEGFGGLDIKSRKRILNNTTIKMDQTFYSNDPNIVPGTYFKIISYF